MQLYLTEAPLPCWWPPECVSECPWDEITPTLFCLPQRGYFLLLTPCAIAELTAEAVLYVRTVYRCGDWGLYPTAGSVVIVRQLEPSGFVYHARQMVVSTATEQLR